MRGGCLLALFTGTNDFLRVQGQSAVRNLTCKGRILTRPVFQLFFSSIFPKFRYFPDPNAAQKERSKNRETFSLGDERAHDGGEGAPLSPSNSPQGPAGKGSTAVFGMQRCFAPVYCWRHVSAAQDWEARSEVRQQTSMTPTEVIYTYHTLKATCRNAPWFGHHVSLSPNVRPPQLRHSPAA